LSKYRWWLAVLQRGREDDGMKC